MENKKTVRIALTKGRIEEGAIDIFESAGIDCSQLLNKGRKLIFRNEECHIEFVLVKAADVFII